MIPGPLLVRTVDKTNRIAQSFPSEKAKRTGEGTTKSFSAQGIKNPAYSVLVPDRSVMLPPVLDAFRQRGPEDLPWFIRVSGC